MHQNRLIGVITLIDDVDLVKRGHIDRDTDSFELWELLAWREEELWTTRFLTDSLRKISGVEDSRLLTTTARKSSKKAISSAEMLYVIPGMEDPLPCLLYYGR
jgi:hypothetical protein